MMYASVSAFIDRVGEHQAIELSDRNNTGFVDEAVLEIALKDSSSQIDGYLLASRYRLPLGKIPENLTRLCCDLARYRLASMSEVGITEEIIERYKMSLKELEQIVKGVIALDVGGEDEAINTASSADNVQFFNDGNRIFARDNPN